MFTASLFLMPMFTMLTTIGLGALELRQLK